LLFDSDEAGQRAADRAISVTLTSGLDVLLAKVPEGKDPCDYLLLAGRSGLEGVLKQALGALEFKWNLVAREFEASATGPGRRRAVDAFVQQLAGWMSRGVVDPIQKGLLVNELSRVLSLPAEELHRQLDKLAKRPVSRSAGNQDQGQPLAGEEASPALLGAEQRALQQVMEVLLNEPAWYAAVEGFFEPTAIRDRRVAAIAVELVNVLRSGEPFQISELIGRFESPEYGGLITDLQARGERRGKFGAVIDGAIPCLQSCQQARQTAALTEEIRNSRKRGDQPDRSEDRAEETAGAVPRGEDERLIALGELARNPGFSTLKARKRFL
jgi:DNA primase